MAASLIVINTSKLKPRRRLQYQRVVLSLHLFVLRYVWQGLGTPAPGWLPLPSQVRTVINEAAAACRGP
jgi:hypothetical protein